MQTKEILHIELATAKIQTNIETNWAKVTNILLLRFIFTWMFFAVEIQFVCLGEKKKEFYPD